MLLLPSNIRYLRKEKKVNQVDIGDAVGVSYNAISNYENGKFFPTADVLAKLCEYFNVSADDLLFKDLATSTKSETFQSALVEKNNHIFFAAKEQAEYTTKWSRKFERDLRYVSIPGVEGDARTFEVYSNSMEPILNNGDYVVCTPCTLAAVKDGQIYAIVRGDAVTDAHPVKITYAKLEHGRVLCIPHNTKEYRSYYLSDEEVKEVWAVEMRITRNIIEPWKNWDIEQRLAMLEEIVLANFPDEKLR